MAETPRHPDREPNKEVATGREELGGGRAIIHYSSGRSIVVESIGGFPWIEERSPAREGWEWELREGEELPPERSFHGPIAENATGNWPPHQGVGSGGLTELPADTRLGGNPAPNTSEK